MITSPHLRVIQHTDTISFYNECQDFTANLCSPFWSNKRGKKLAISCMNLWLHCSSDGRPHWLRTLDIPFIDQFSQKTPWSNELDWGSHKTSKFFHSLFKLSIFNAYFRRILAFKLWPDFVLCHQNSLKWFIYAVILEKGNR